MTVLFAVFYDTCIFSINYVVGQMATAHAARMYAGQVLCNDRASVRPSVPKLSVGPFCVTRSNPIHQLTDPTQPDPTHYKWKNLDPTLNN